MKFLAVAVIALACSLQAFADKVTLKDGKVYEGVVIEQTDKVVKIRTANAVFTLPMDRVASVEKSESLLGERDRRFAALDAATGSAYLETARWLAGPGREFYDEKMFRRLCEIATFLDPRQGYDAQSLLANHLVELKETRAAALAWKRALLARPGDPDAVRALEPLVAEITRAAKDDVREFSAVLDLILCDILEEAAPRLATVDARSLPEHTLKPLGMPFEKFRADILSRVPCKSCRGARKLICPDCEGKGELVCRKCVGKGRKPEWLERGDAGDHFAESACPACFGVGSFSCVKCASQRPISIQFKAVGQQAKQPVQVTPVPGKDKEALETVISLKTYKSKDSALVNALVPCKPTTGGEITCTACQGALFAPPMTPIDKEGVKECMTDLKDYAEGRKTWTPLDEAELDRYDKDAVADRMFRFKNGKWAK